MKKTTIILLLVFLQIPSLDALPVKDSLELELTQLIKNSKIPGLAITIASDKGVRYTGGFGYKDKELKIAYDSLTIQPIASISKSIIGIAIMKLVEEGKVKLDADINTLLPFKIINPNFPNEKITLFQLATHTSSITDTYKAESAGYFIIDKKASTEHLPREFCKNYKRYLKTDFLEYEDYLKTYLSINGKMFSKKIFGKYKPGTQYSYRNIASTLAAYIVEIVAGQSFEVYTKAQIFEPLGMKHTSWSKEGLNIKNMAKLYLQNGAKVPEYTDIFFPSSTLHTNSHDIGKFMVEVINGYHGKGNLLNAKSYQYAMSNQLKNANLPEARGIFWFLNQDESNVFHTGANYGVTCRLYFNPTTNKALFFMMNMSAFEDKELTKVQFQILQILGKYSKKLD